MHWLNGEAMSRSGPELWKIHENRLVWEIVQSTRPWISHLSLLYV